jgi:hypothetical protein
MMRPPRSLYAPAKRYYDSPNCDYESTKRYYDSANCDYESMNRCYESANHQCKPEKCALDRTMVLR